MKQTLLFAFFGLFILQTRGQVFYNSGMYYYNNNSNYKRNHVKQCTEKKYNKRSNAYYISSSHELNIKGKDVAVLYNNKKGESKGKIFYTYKNDTLILSYVYLKHNDDTLWKYLYQYDDRNNMVGVERYMGAKSKLNYTDNYTYNSANKVIKYLATNRNGIVTHRYEYDYYENGDRKETRFYDKKNKLKKRYTYVCSPRGEAYNGKTKELNYCKKTQPNTDDGSYLEIVERKNEKNEVVRNIYFYSSDSLLTRFETYDKIGALEQATDYSYDSNKNPVEIKTSESGRQKYLIRKEYSSKDLVSKSSLYKKDKLLEELSYEYVFF